MQSALKPPQQNSLFRNLSFWFLMVANIATIFFATGDDWSLLSILCVYWSQSVIIGIFHFFRMVHLEKLKNDEYAKSNKPPLKPLSTFSRQPYFFTLHFGFFHIFFALYLILGFFFKQYGEPPDSETVVQMIMIIILFFINNLFTYVYNRPKDTAKQHLDSLTFYPYPRLVITHLAIIFGPAIINETWIFMIAKTAADTIIHLVDNNGRPKIK